MSLKEESTDGMTGMDNAKTKAENGYMPIIDGYNSKEKGNTSITNKKVLWRMI